MGHYLHITFSSYSFLPFCLYGLSCVWSLKISVEQKVIIFSTFCQTDLASFHFSSCCLCGEHLVSSGWDSVCVSSVSIIIMSYYCYITGIYKSYRPELNRTLRSSSVPRHVPDMDPGQYSRCCSYCSFYILRSICSLLICPSFFLLLCSKL